MQTRKSSETKIRKEKKDETKIADDKQNKTVFTISTPREYGTKTTASDIYTQKKVNKAPKKVPGVSATSSVSPMKGLLKSSASSSSQISRTSERTPNKSGAISVRSEAKTPHSTKSEIRTTHSTKSVARTTLSTKSQAKTSHPTKLEKPTKKLFTNVTVNSPVVKRKLDLNSERVKEVESVKKVFKSKEVGSGEPRITKEVDMEKSKARHRTKTRTLDESEVKILTPDKVDNNAEMKNLSKLVAKPKAFYVDLDEDRRKNSKEISDEEDVSYEDDFESYESDFDSYHSDEASGSEAGGSQASGNASESDRSERNETASAESSLKEKDEEKMLDSGNFDLRDQRPVRTKPAVMAFILEDPESDKVLLEDRRVDERSIEDDKKASLDEGFQDMSSSSIRAVEVLDRPLFIDFKKSKQNKLKRKFNERLKQRANDLLGMITLHEMTYSLFEMQPISYDRYMATFGRSNYTQSGVQTFDDGITEEVQTDEVTVTQKWTQYPVEFSKNIYDYSKGKMRKYSENTEDYLNKFTFLINEKHDGLLDSEIKMDENYKENPLRILLEQKDGVGSEMLPYEIYKSKLKSNDYNAGKLSKFLKKYESKVNRILSSNTGNKDSTDFEKSGKLPFSEGHINLSPKFIDEKYYFLKCSKIYKAFFSDTKSNLILTVHKNSKSVGKKSLICLWDLSVTREPMKILLAIDDVNIGRFRGNTDGIFVAALEDGSIHLWDLTEEPTWRDDVATENISPKIEEIESDKLTQIEKDREWNSRNSQGGSQAPIPFALQSSAYTNSAQNMSEDTDCIVGLEMISNHQIASLQRIGIITTWNIIQEKSKASKDIGKAYWSKLKLEKNLTINITEHIDVTIKENNLYNFNLNSAKRKILQRKQSKTAKGTIRPSTSKLEFDSDRPYSAASLRKKVLPVEINVPKSWENGIVCYDLKIVNFNEVNRFLVAKNCGEVLCCKRCLGVVRIERFSVATDTSSITNLDVSSEGIPYFFAATDTGTVNLCSLLDSRVLLTLDCRNIPSPHEAIDKCQADHKGRFINSVAKPSNKDVAHNRLEIKSIHWSRTNHCSIFALLLDGTMLHFDLMHSDINARSVTRHVAAYCTQSDNTLALISDGDVEVHRLSNEQRSNEYLHLFNKYVTLL